MYLQPHYIDKKSAEMRVKHQIPVLMLIGEICLLKLLQSKWFTDTKACD